MKLQQVFDENYTANILIRLSDAITDNDSTRIDFDCEDISGDLVDQLKNSVRIEAATKRKGTHSSDSEDVSIKQQRNNESTTESSEMEFSTDERIRYSNHVIYVAALMY